MKAYEINCDECGCWKEGNNLKTICINCYNEVIKENRRLKKIIHKNKLKENKKIK